MANTEYLPAEGQEHLARCMRLAAGWCADNHIETLVIFSGTGVGPLYVARNLLPLEEYRKLQVVTVTPAVGRIYRKVHGDAQSAMPAGLAPEVRDELSGHGIRVVSAHLPFKPYTVGYERTTEWNRVAEAYGIFGGGLALCIQAAMMAADAGAVEHGARIVAASADTALEIGHACRSESFLSSVDGLLLGHIICRPAKYTISKREHEAVRPLPEPPVVEAPPATPDPPALPAPPNNKDTSASPVGKKTTPKRKR